MERQSKRAISYLRNTVSNLLERHATETEKKQGLDLADYLVGCSIQKLGFCS